MFFLSGGSESHLVEGDVEAWCAVDVDFEVVGVGGDLVEEFVQQGASFLIGGDFPDGVEVEGGEDLGDLVKAFELFSGGERFDGGAFDLVGVDEPCEALFFLSEQLGADLAVVVQAQELVPVGEKGLQGPSVRVLAGPPAALRAGPPPPP